MSGLDQIHALYDYNQWANGHVLDAASRLSEQEFTKELGASFGSVRGNLTHTLSAQNVWLSRWTAAQPPAAPRAEATNLLEALRQEFEATDRGLRAFVESLSEDGLGHTFEYVDTQGNPQRRVLWQTMLHLVNHGTHHRAETALLLTSLRAPPRQLDYVFYELERAGGPPRLV